jgi:predicted PurR-regulated permease PerM
MPAGDTAEPDEGSRQGASGPGGPQRVAPAPRPRGPLRFDVVAISLALLALLALFHTLSIAATLFMPIVLALLGRFALSPIVRRMRSFGIPAAIGAGLIVAGLGIATFASARVLSEPAMEWVERAPRTLREIERKIRFIRQPVAQVVESAEDVAEAAAGGDEKRPVVVQGESLLSSAIARAQALIALLLVTAVLMYFMLASGDRFGRRFAMALSRAPDPARAKWILDRIEQDISRHLLTITLINVGLGLVVAFAMWLLGMPSPMLWGVLAGVLNYMPFVGPFLTSIVLAGVALITFDDPWHTLGVVSVFVTLTGVEGMLITPALLGRRLMLSPAAVFASVMLWSWLWGVTGAIIAVPLLSALRILCVHVPPLAPLGALFVGGMEVRPPDVSDAADVGEARVSET